MLISCVGNPKVIYGFVLAYAKSMFSDDMAHMAKIIGSFFFITATIYHAHVLQVQIVAEGSMVTMDYREDRVRVFIDKDNKVVSTPRIG